jgi:hypothetical protein
VFAGNYFFGGGGIYFWAARKDFFSAVEIIFSARDFFRGIRSSSFGFVKTTTRKPSTV